MHTEITCYGDRIIGQTYRNAYTQPDLGIGDLAEKLKESMRENQIHLERQRPQTEFRDEFIAYKI